MGFSNMRFNKVKWCLYAGIGMRRQPFLHGVLGYELVWARRRRR